MNLTTCIYNSKCNVETKKTERQTAKMFKTNIKFIKEGSTVWQPQESKQGRGAHCSSAATEQGALAPQGPEMREAVASGCPLTGVDRSAWASRRGAASGVKGAGTQLAGRHRSSLGLSGALFPTKVPTCKL